MNIDKKLDSNKENANTKNHLYDSLVVNNKVKSNNFSDNYNNSILNLNTEQLSNNKKQYNNEAKLNNNNNQDLNINYNKKFSSKNSLNILNKSINTNNENNINNYEKLSGKEQNNFISSTINKDIITNNNYFTSNISEEVNNTQKINNFNLNNDDTYIIKLRNLHKTYLLGVEGIPALRGVSLNIKKGEFVIIFGTSGGGKTSLLNLIGTIDTPSRGDIKLFDINIKSNTTDNILSQIRLKEVSFVFQSFNLLSNMNVIENVELPMKILGELSSKEIRCRAKELLNKVGLSNRLYHFPNQLSGGEQQRVTIARALSNKPKIMLLDEPTGDLDSKNSNIVLNILLDLNINESITMIMVTHDISLKYYGNKIVRMIDGKISSINEVDENERNIAISKLKELANQNKTNLKEGGINNNINVDDYKNAMNNTNNINISKTFVRDIKDYKILFKRLNNNDN